MSHNTTPQIARDHSLAGNNATEIETNANTWIDEIYTRVLGPDNILIINSCFWSVNCRVTRALLQLTFEYDVDVEWVFNWETVDRHHLIPNKRHDGNLLMTA